VSGVLYIASAGDAPGNEWPSQIHHNVIAAGRHPPISARLRLRPLLLRTPGKDARAEPSLLDRRPNSWITSQHRKRRGRGYSRLLAFERQPLHGVWVADSNPFQGKNCVLRSSVAQCCRRHLGGHYHTGRQFRVVESQAELPGDLRPSRQSMAISATLAVKPAPAANKTPEKIFLFLEWTFLPTGGGRAEQLRDKYICGQESCDMQKPRFGSRGFAFSSNRKLTLARHRRALHLMAFPTVPIVGRPENRNQSLSCSPVNLQRKWAPRCCANRPGKRIR